ncbi:MAG TPA: hypothetical protein VHB21_08995, partial [Minicystis sp.]|nr:hypothetical protein [Minicystis sp.]
LVTSMGSCPANCVLDLAGATATDGAPLVLRPASCTPVGPNAIRLSILTGDDSLRGDSTAQAIVTYATGATDTIDLTYLGPYLDDCPRTVDASLSYADPITNVAIALQSHLDWFETDDDWYVREVGVSVSHDGNPAAAPRCADDVPGEFDVTDGQPLTFATTCP